jgi:hypothetical protein
MLQNCLGSPFRRRSKKTREGKKMREVRVEIVVAALKAQGLVLEEEGNEERGKMKERSCDSILWLFQYIDNFVMHFEIAYQKNKPKTL